MTLDTFEQYQMNGADVSLTSQHYIENNFTSQQNTRQLTSKSVEQKERNETHHLQPAIEKQNLNNNQ